MLVMENMYNYSQLKKYLKLTKAKKGKLTLHNRSADQFPDIKLVKNK